MKNKDSFWLTNLSNMNISLSDLNLTVKAYSSVNLLDEKHYSYNREQLEKSVATGSIFKKKNNLVVRKIAPIVNKVDMPYTRESILPSRERSLYEIKDEYYEELAITDEEFADENAETAEMDTQKK